MLIGALQISILAQETAATKVESMKEIQICDLFRRLDVFDGKHVAVRGVYRFSMELAGLYSEGCPEPLILDRAERAQALSTEFLAKSPEQRAEYANFTEVVDRIAKAGGRQAVHVTFVGTVVARNPNLHRLGQSKGARRFGHLGLYPARLEVEGIQNITIEDESRQPSNMGLKR
jgi:hypothetical protein